MREAGRNGRGRGKKEVVNGRLGEERKRCEEVGGVRWSTTMEAMGGRMVDNGKGSQMLGR